MIRKISKEIIRQTKKILKDRKDKKNEKEKRNIR